VHADALGPLVVAGDLARSDVPAVTPPDSLDLAIRFFAGRDIDELPVVDPQSHRLAGVITRRHLIDAYNHELMKRDMVAGLAGGLSAAASSEISLGEGHRMVELDAPGAFIDHTIRDLDIRTRYGVQVLLVKRIARPGSAERIEVVPGPDTIVQRGDRLVLMGRSEALEALRRW
jgi:CIC family chloride channel protein